MQELAKTFCKNATSETKNAILSCDIRYPPGGPGGPEAPPGILLSGVPGWPIGCPPGGPGGVPAILLLGVPVGSIAGPRGSPSAPRRSSRDRGAGARPHPRASPCGDAVGQSRAGFSARLHRRSRGLTSRARNVRLLLLKPFTQSGASARVAPTPRLVPKC